MLYPTGVQVLSNGAVSCLSGYYAQGPSCLRSTSSLSRLSTLSNSLLSYSSNGLSSGPWIGSSQLWSPTTNTLNEYLSISALGTAPFILFQIDIQGNSNGWVTGYIIQFRNRVDAPFVCWNSCNQVSGNTDGASKASLNLYHPIIASEVRLYPVGWNRAINLQV